MTSLIDVLKRFGLGREPEEGSGYDSIAMDGSEQAKRIIGGKLYEGAMAEVSAAAGAKKLADFVKDSKEHCDEHRRTEEQLHGELRAAREANQEETDKQFRLGGLLSEIASALDSGRVLTGGDVRIGKRNALNRQYYQMTYLPVPKPTAAAAGGKVDDKTAAGVGFVPNTVEQPQA